MHRLKFTPNFLIVDYGGMSISIARERLTPKKTRQSIEPPRFSIHVFVTITVYLVSILYRFDVSCAFLIAENDGKTISRLRVVLTLSYHNPGVPS
jgi:hypothetical protein